MAWKQNLRQFWWKADCWEDFDPTVERLVGSRTKARVKGKACLSRLGKRVKILRYEASEKASLPRGRRSWEHKEQASVVVIWDEGPGVDGVGRKLILSV